MKYSEYSSIQSPSTLRTLIVVRDAVTYAIVKLKIPKETSKPDQDHTPAGVANDAENGTVLVA